MNHRISNINDLNLQEIINTSATSSLEILQGTKFRSTIWDIYISGISYGIYISVCDFDYITLTDIANSINNKVSTFLN